MADVEAFEPVAKILESDIAQYKTAASDLVGQLRKAADAFEREELLEAGEESRLGSMMSALGIVRGHIENVMKESGADVSHAHTVEDLEREYHKLEIDRLLGPLDAVQNITASQEKYAAPLKELQDRAARAAQSLRDADGPPSEESRHAADQAQAVLRVMDGDGKQRGKGEERIFSDLGISAAILLGLTLGQYSRDASPGRQTEQSGTGNDVSGGEASEDRILAADNEAASADVHTTHIARSEFTWFDDIVHPLSKLQDYKPNARRFLHTIESFGRFARLAVVVLSSAYFENVITVRQVVSLIRREAGGLIPAQLKDDLKKLCRQLVRHGILAAYRLDSTVVYVLTRFGLGSLMMRGVQDALNLPLLPSDAAVGPVAVEAMPSSLLVLGLMKSELNTRIDDWLFRETGLTLKDAEYRDRFSPVEGAIQLPRGYGVEGERFVVMPYEMPRNSDYSGNALFVVTNDRSTPFQDETEVEEGSLLLFEDELYERCNGKWEMKRTAPRPGQLMKSTARKRRKRKR